MASRRRVLRAARPADDAEGTAGFHEPLPDLRRRLVGDVQLEAVLTGVTRPGDDGRHAVHVPFGKPVVLDGGQVDVHQRLHSLQRLRALDGDLRIAVAGVLDLNVAGLVLQNPADVLVPVGGVDAQHVPPLVETVHQQVVHERALRIHEAGIVDLAVLELLDVVAGELLEQIQGVWTGDEHLAHVGHVEQPHPAAHREVFVHGGTELDRHLITGEGDHLATARPAHFGERGFLHRFAIQGNLPGRNVSASRPKGIERNIM